VKLHAAVRDERIRFHLLHRNDLVRLRQQMVCTHEKQPVPVESQTRGFEVEEGKYIIVSPEELGQTAPEESRTIEVHEFVAAERLDPIFLERGYYLEPDTIREGYNELVEVLQEMAVAGICTWTMRKRSYLGALQAREKMLRLTTLRHADEVIAVNSLGLQEIALQQLIEKKARGEKIAVLRPRILKPTPSNQLLEALEASLRNVA
jgi:DNA end-binding protein Ku